MRNQKTEMFLNTVKITLAATIAILTAMVLRLDYAVSAGVIAMLSIQSTKKETVRTAAERVLAFATALWMAYFCFLLFGYEIKAFMLFIFLFVYVCSVFKWNGAITLNVVLISHILEGGNMLPDVVGNEVTLFGVGVCAGVVANMHLKKNVGAMEALKERTDEQIKRILSGMSEYILEETASDYNRDCFDLLEHYIRDAKNMAAANYGNQFRRADIYDIEYINMREKQCQILYEMYKLIRYMHAKPFTAKKISLFLKKVSVEYHQANKVDKLLEEFYELTMGMRHAPLPTKRNEFEDRAKLFILLCLLEEFLQLKKEFVQKFVLEEN